ncbi:pyridoxine/pyridoxamine 5'-phosphate oxidase-like isoform X1 [Rhopilema esculentum]|uniref:pyridoxine/pyridoxamine 5'-phosphate oxidase-like isoform X1 n=2 Tax=Rhopilema esculentum TaxID=499914 RepID=UPI0031D3D395
MATVLRQGFVKTASSLRYKHFVNNCVNLLVRNAEMSSTGSILSKDEVASMRINYKSHGLKLEEFEKKEPLAMFDAWFKMAKECPLIKEANSMSLATVSEDFKPSVRIVLLKGYDNAGFRFFTNYSSRKGKDIEKNPNVAVMFYWEPLERQVRVEGKVQKLSESESENYFHMRPRASQLGALASNQSCVIESKEVSEKRYADLEKKYEGVEIPKPDCWGGYQLIPETFEFWCGGKGRMHDRVVFRRPGPADAQGKNPFAKIGDDGWVYEFLSP